jgi:ankyrin repeat protein
MLTRRKLRYSLPARGTLSEGSDANRYAKTGNVAGLKRLIGLGIVQISATTPDGWTLLHAAAYYGQLEIVRFLLGQDADYNCTEHGRRKPGHLASMRALNVGASRNQKCVAELIPGGECFKDDHEMTPIHVAVLELYDSGHKLHPDLSSLLKFADDVENALKRKDLDSIESERREESPMFEEIFHFYVQQVRASRTERRKVRIIDAADAVHGWTPYLWATVTGRREAMDILINNDADPFTLSEKKRNGIHLAAESRYPEIMASVLSIPRGPNGEWYDINLGDFWEETPLHVAASGSATCVRMLLENGADRAAQQEDGKVPLHYAALVGGNECVKVDIVDQLSADLGPHINCADKEGLTPIFDLLGSAPCVDLLTRRGADLAVRDRKGKSLIHHAAIDDNANSLRILLEHSPVELTTAHDKEGNTPISSAFASKSSACASILLEIDALGDFHGKDGWSLVHHAALWGDADVLEAVVKHRTFRRGARTRKGESAADIAKSAGGGTADGNWKGIVKELLLEYDSRGRIARSAQEHMLMQAEILALTR